MFLLSITEILSLAYIFISQSHYVSSHLTNARSLALWPARKSDVLDDIITTSTFIGSCVGKLEGSLMQKYLTLGIMGIFHWPG